MQENSHQKKKIGIAMYILVCILSSDKIGFKANGFIRDEEDIYYFKFQFNRKI